MPLRKNIVLWLKHSQRETFTPAYHKGAAYTQLADSLAARHNLFFAYDAGSYRGNDVFAPVYEYKNGALLPSPTQTTADAIYNLGNIPQEDFKTLRAGITNTPAFKKFCASKRDMYEYLREFSPLTIPVATEAEFFSAIERIPTETFVFKPNTGTNGAGVCIFEKKNVVITPEMRVTLAQGALVQEFIDTARGIPSICDSYHDLRLVMLNDAVALTHVRIPEAGSRIASYQRGASIRELSVDMLPQEILAFAAAVHKKVSARFPKPMYSMDIGIGTAGLRLFELNGHTAFPWPEFACRNSFIEHLVAHIENA
ncbi:MAG: hypothetical protein HYW65_01380 [Candidatus Liptonbacteria bacterium]|nr:hypothetical protein [Candidatus Liptonbacteria bacterium]